MTVLSIEMARNSSAKVADDTLTLLLCYCLVLISVLSYGYEVQNFYFLKHIEVDQNFLIIPKQ